MYLSTKGVQAIKEGYSENNAVFAVQEWKANKVKSVPFVLYKVKNAKAAKHYKALMSRPSADTFRKAIEVKEKAFDIVEEHAVLTLLNNPSLTHGRGEFFKLEIIYRDLTGSSYIWMEPQPSGGIRLELLPSTEVELLGGPMGLPQGIQLRNYPDLKIPYEQVIHTRHANPVFDVSGGHLYGQSKLTAINRVLTKYKNGQDAEVELFENRGGRGIITPKDNEQADMDEAAVQEVQNRLNTKLTEGGAGKVVANSIPLDFLNSSMSPVDLNILQSLSDAKKDICSVYGIHPLIFGWDQGKYDNMNEARKMSLIDGVISDMEDFKDNLNNKLLPAMNATGYYLDYDYQALPEMQADLAALTDRLNKAWWLTVDEKRVEMDFPATGDMNGGTVLVPANLTPISDVGLDSATLSEL